MDRFDPFVKYADVYGDIINWEKDPMNKPQNQNKYFFSDGKTYYEQICKMLRLMSVFKEAFNQIYSNEDEISEAWENFVNNLSASVVEGSEPDVTLTWTDDSVNFEFTMVPGVQGDPGVGITSISFNSDYTMTITLSDGNTYTSMSLKGETGPQGPQGETGSGLQILDVYATLADLQSAHPTGQPGDAYQVGSEGSYTLYIWSSSQSAWVQAGTLGTVSPSVSNPLMDGTAYAGSLNQYSRGDHVHPTDASRASKEELDALIKTSQALIDQSFTYRESPAIQDGLARIDKIKGNTIMWNQLVQPTSRTSTSNGITYVYTTDGTMEISGTAGGTSVFFIDMPNIYPSKKVLIKLENDATISGTGCYARLAKDSGGTNLYSKGVTSCNFTTLKNEIIIDVPSVDTNDNPIDFWNMFQIRIANGTEITGTLTIKPQLFDLTLMGLDSLTDAEIRQWFADNYPLPYYDYNAGTLLSFNGSGIKTVGKNLFDLSQFANGTITFENGVLNGTGAQFHTAYGTYATAKKLNCPKGSQITISFDAWTDQNATSTGNGLIIATYHYDGTQEDAMVPNATGTPRHFTLQRQDIEKIGWSYGTQGANRWHVENFQVEIGTETDYEPYTSSTLSLPISTYFPSGMKSAGNVYDELTPSKAITRIGSRAYQSGDESDTSVITDGTTTYYLLTTPTETAVDLDLDFMAYEDGTEQLLPVNGSVPSTSPIIADMTYLSIDDAMEYILDKLSNVPLNTQQRLEALEDDVTDLQTDVGTLQTDVSGLQTSVGNINTNIGQLSSTVAGHTASISGMQSDISDLNTGLSDLEDTVTDNTSRIGTLETDLASTDGQVQNLATSVSGLDSTVTAQGETVTALDNFVSSIANTRNPGYMSSDNSIGITSAFLNMTLAAGQSTWANIPLPTIMAGFIPLFVVGAATGDGSVCLFKIPSTYNQNNIYRVGVKNTSNSEVTTQVSIEILCIKQRQSQ